MKPITINYENLRGWMRLNKLTYQLMAQEATRQGAPVSAASLGKYVRHGAAMPSTVIVALREAYGWTAEEVAQLVMNGPAPRAVRQEPSRADNALKMIALALKPYLGKEDQA